MREKGEDDGEIIGWGKKWIEKVKERKKTKRSEGGE